MTDKVTIFEMGPRDGLQNEPEFVATADKIRLVDMLSATGLRKIEVTSFVSPKRVPQMADAAEVLAGITRKADVVYSALTPNMRGFKGAIAAGVDEIAVFASASEGFSQANINCSIDESFARFAPVIAAAQAAKIPVRGYVSCVTDCPYDGAVLPESVARVVAALREMGCYEVSLGDTIGQATPDRIRLMLDAVVPLSGRLAGHFHDTNGRALENIAVALGHGLRVFDAAVGGLGGCPYAPGAKGNVATEAVVQMLTAQGFDTGIDAAKLAQAAVFARNLRAGQDDV
ncbi:hydroxymethylglutaryl-CoA lyase [Roseovarius sp. Pro17]|uniref:hydroxymethylglutaryl-CoA lyase n=1 Tax=Roseovarius sp. Pro17 TaxID=3108175 RepID=UPI002D76EA1F|nr:hydroxymethylglutaryl-CoA lyase [Roseovarius sp. Pro17]